MPTGMFPIFLILALFGLVHILLRSSFGGREPLPRGSSMAEIEHASSLATKVGMHLLFQELGNEKAYILDSELTSATHHMESFN
ncbi:hypothetical protein Sjap_023982 [Stephania japonica]|uniref:ATP synthase F0 subunit 8 n=1 Tax=Stephania japonica TaxID=461633 RepID=A0AAP0ECM4_9MAGN